MAYQDTGLSRRRPQRRQPRRAPTAGNSGGYGLPFAYDPLWRYQTDEPDDPLLAPRSGYYFER